VNGKPSSGLPGRSLGGGSDGALVSSPSKPKVLGLARGCFSSFCYQAHFGFLVPEVGRFRTRSRGHRRTGSWPRAGCTSRRHAEMPRMRRDLDARMAEGPFR
jgi:hypothetical protein